MKYLKPIKNIFILIWYVEIYRDVFVPLESVDSFEACKK